jgi:hypothetical protein
MEFERSEPAGLRLHSLRVPWFVFELPRTAIFQTFCSVLDRRHLFMPMRKRLLNLTYRAIYFVFHRMIAEFSLRGGARNLSLYLYPPSRLLNFLLKSQTASRSILTILLTVERPILLNYALSPLTVCPIQRTLCRFLQQEIVFFMKPSLLTSGLRRLANGLRFPGNAETPGALASRLGNALLVSGATSRRRCRPRRNCAAEALVRKDAS